MPRMARDDDTKAEPDIDNFAGWNCLLTILGVNLLMFILATFVSRCG